MVEKRVGHGKAQGRVDWKRDGWPDAKFAVTSAKCGLRTDQQREKREESREKRDGSGDIGWLFYFIFHVLHLRRRV